MRFQDLRFHKMSDAAFRHDRDRHRVHDLQDHVGVAHARHAALRADVRRDALQRHHRARAGLFGDLGLFGRHHVHDDAALEHLGQTLFNGKRTSLLFHNLSPWFGSKSILPRRYPCTRPYVGLSPTIPQNAAG